MLITSVLGSKICNDDNEDERRSCSKKVEDRLWRVKSQDEAGGGGEGDQLKGALRWLREKKVKCVFGGHGGEDEGQDAGQNARRRNWCFSGWTVEGRVPACAWLLQWQ